MRKSAIHSITAPGPAVENLAVDAGYEKPKPKPPPPDKAPKKIHPLVEVAMANKVADFDNVNNFLLPPKTEGENLSLERLSALSHVSDRSTGEKPKTDIDVIPAKGGDVYARSGRQSIGAHRNISSLQQSKAAAFAKAELLSALYPLGLSRAASEAVGNVLLKTAFQGIGNFPFAGQQAVMREAIPERGAGGTKQVDGTSNLAKRGPAVKNLANTSSHIGSALGMTGIGTTGSAARASVFTTEPGSLPFGGSTDGKVSVAEFHPMNKAAALVNLVKHGMRKQAVLDFLRVSQDKKAALLTIGRLQKASEQERATAKLAGLMRTYELANSDGKGAMPSGPEGPVPDALTGSKTQFASDWCNRLDPFSRKVPLARVMGRRKGNL
jgi:hypothetical protein